MFSFHRISRFRTIVLQNFRAISYYKNNLLVPLKHEGGSKGNANLKVQKVHLSSDVTLKAEDINSKLFEKVCEETLESLTDFFEELVETKNELESADISYISGVLTANLGKYGTYVINRQSPNKQIWLSSPLSGPKRYDYLVNGSCWIYRHDHKSLHQLLSEELSILLKENIDLSNCCHSKIDNTE